MATTTTSEEAQAGEQPGSDREQWIMAAKIAVGFVVAFIMTGVVGPIVLAIVVGLATGHR